MLVPASYVGPGRGRYTFEWAQADRGHRLHVFANYAERLNMDQAGEVVSSWNLYGKQEISVHTLNQLSSCS